MKQNLKRINHQERCRMENEKSSLRRWLPVILGGMLLLPLPARAANITTPTSDPTTMTAPHNGSGNQYRRGEPNGEGYTMSADELGLRRQSGGQPGAGTGNGDRTRKRLRDQSGSGSRHRYGSSDSGSYGSSGSYGGGSYGGGGGGRGRGGGRRR
jgi:uncharacterized membrane protein YgcG